MWYTAIFILQLLFIEIDGVVAFAGGFGAAKSKAKTKKPKKNKKRGLASEDFAIRPSPTANKDVKDSGKDDTPKLDRFGLPILTAENFFPNLPSDTELEYTSQDEERNMETVRNSMSNFIPLDFDLFDENGVEKIFSDSKPWKLKLLHKSPPVLAIENFFTDAECEEYIKMTKAPEKSEDESSSPLKINSARFSSLAQSQRTSTTWYCHYRQVPTFLAKAKRLLNDLPLEQMEEAQVVRYRTGEEFSWHYDEIPREQLANGGQRIATLLVYLNTLSATGGGGTIFRDLKNIGGIGELKMQPKKGSALLFFPSTSDGTPDDRTLHKGEVAVEEKTIAQMWIHERKYKSVVPEGNSHDAAVEVVKEKEIELGYEN